jgi:hypothetical protein
MASRCPIICDPQAIARLPPKKLRKQEDKKLRKYEVGKIGK